MNKQTKRTINSIVFLVLGAALFYWAIGKQDTSELWSEIINADLKWVLLAVVCGVLSHLLRAMRWNLLLAPMGYKAKTVNSFHAVILGYLVNFALPRVGEITRPVVLNRLEGIPVNKLLGTVVVERVVDMIITLIIAVAIFFIQLNTISGFVSDLFANVSSNMFAIYGISIAGFLAIIIFFYLKREWFYKLPIINKFKDFIEGILDGCKTIFKMKRTGLFIVFSILIWFMYFLMPYFVLFALDGTSHLGVSAGLTILLFGTAAMIVPIPGGVGTYEVLVPAALALYGIGHTLASSYALIAHAIQFIAIIGVGIFSVFYFVVKTQQIRKNGMEKPD